MEEQGKWDSSIESLEKLSGMTLDPLKHLEFTKRLLNAYERAGRMSAFVKLSSFLRSSEAKVKYEGLDLPPTDELLLKEIQIREEIEEKLIVKEVEVRRFRLGSDPLPILKEKVRNEVVAASDLDLLLMEWLHGRDDMKMAERLMDRLKRKIPTCHDKKETKLLLEIASKYRKESTLAKEILLEFRIEDIFDFNDLGPYKDHLGLELSEEELERVAASDYPQSIFVALFCTVTFWNRGELGLAHKWLKAAVERIEQLNQNYGANLTIDRLRRLEGLILAKDLRYQEAIPLLVGALKEQSENVEIYTALVNCYVALDEHQKAIELYRVLLLKRPDDITLLCDLGWQYYLIHEYEQAINCLQEALLKSGNTPSAPVLTRLARVYWDANEENRNDKEICLHYFLQAAKADPTNFEAFLYLGLYYLNIGVDISRAERCFAKALSLNPDCLSAALELSQIWLYAARETTGEVLLQRIVLVLEPFSQSTRNTRLWQLLGSAFLGLSKYHASTTAFQNALKGERPDEKRCLLGLGEGYRQQGRFVAAIKAYTRAMELDTKCLTANMGLAAVHSDMRKYEESRRWYQEVPENAARIEALRVGYLLVGDLIKLGCTHEAIKLSTEILNGAYGMLSKWPKCQRTCWKMLSDTCLTSLTLRHVKAISIMQPILSNILTQIVIEFEGNDVWSGIDEILPKSGITSDLIRVAALCQINLIVGSEEEIVISRAWTDLAIVLLHAGKSKQILSIVVDCAEQAVSHVAFPVLGLVVLGIAHLRLEDYALAQHYLIRALHHDDQCTSAWLGLAYLYSILGDGDLVERALLQVQAGENGAPGWLYEAFLAHRSGNDKAASLVLQASEMSDARAHPVHVLAILAAKKNDKKEESVLITKVALLRRMAFRDDDPIAKLILPRLERQVERNVVVEQIARTIIDNTLDSTELASQIEALRAVCTPEGAWLSAYIYSQILNDPIRAMNIVLSCLETHLFNEQIWCDVLFWFTTTKDSEGISRIAIDWLRLRITPELAERLVILPAIIAIRTIWHTELPEDIARIIKNNERFLQDQ